MELELIRTYYPEGTNAVISHKGKVVCHAIELPWRDNLTGQSCIPEGRYVLQKRFSARWKNHIEITNVPDRSLILIHPANDAKRELRGCVAPVRLISGVGTGHSSRKALDKLEKLVFEAFERQEQVIINIYSLN